LKHFLVVFAGKQIETVDAKSLNIGAITGDDCGDTFHCVVPFTILDMDLTLFGEYRGEVGIEHSNLGEGGQTFIIALGLLENFCASEQGLKVLLVAAVVFV